MQQKPVENIVVSRFYVTKSSRLLQSKRLLQITTQSIILDTLPLNLSSREVVEWKSFRHCVAAEQHDKKSADEDPAETHDVYLLYGIQDYIKVTCADRRNLIADVLRCYDQYRQRTHKHFDSEVPLVEGVKELSPNSNGTLFSVSMKVFRTFLELKHTEIRKGNHDQTVYQDFRLKDLPPLHMPAIQDNTIVIPLPAVEKLEKTAVGLKIIIKDSETQHTFIFHDMERTHRITDRIRTNAKTYLLMDIPTGAPEQLEQVGQKELSINTLKNLHFQIPAYKLLQTGQLQPIIIALNETEFLEINPESLLVNEKIKMQGILEIVRFNTGAPGFQLILRHFEVVTYLPPPDSRDIILSCLVAALKNKSGESSTLTLHEIVPSSIPPVNLFVKCWPENQPDKDYLVSILKSICDPANDRQFYDNLREFNLYPNIVTYVDHDPLPLEFICLLFKKYATIANTVEFNNYASVYSRYVKSRTNLNFSHRPPTLSAEYIGPQISDTEHRYLIEQLEKEMTAKIVNFKYHEDDKKPLLELSHLTFPDILFKIEELLKALAILMTSKPYFREFTSNKKQRKFYIQILQATVQMLDSEWPSLSAHASAFLGSFIKFSNEDEIKTETLNKKLLITSEVNIMRKISEVLARRVLVKASKPYLQEDPHIINICSILRILKALVYNRKESTAPDDLHIVMVFLCMPYYFAIFNFLTRYRSFPCSNKATLLLNAVIQTVDTKEKYKKMQEYVLNHSSLILYHINQALSSPSLLEKQLSVILLCHIFRDNANACALIVRIFPKPLFRRVDATINDISKWALQQWEAFFEIVRMDFNNATQQWNDACRKECISKLEKADKDVCSKLRYLKAAEIPALFEASGSVLCDALLEIRWNHEEFEMKYDILQEKILVGKYYLTSLVKEGESPGLTVPIIQSTKFWSQLKIRFFSSSDPREQKKILKTMILVYKIYFHEIRDTTTMSYWLKIIETKEHSQSRYLILQLIYTLTSVDDQLISRSNLKQLIDYNGLRILTDMLAGLHFAEDHNVIYNEDFVKARKYFYRSNPEIEMLYNYSNLKLEKQAYSESLLKACTVNIIMRIYRSVFTKRLKDDQLLYPLPKAKYQILEKNPISCILNMLLLNDNETRKETLEFLLKNLSDRFSYKALAFDTPLYEFLIVNLREKTTRLVSELLLVIYQQLKAEAGVNYGKVIDDYLSVSFESMNPSTRETAHKIFPILKYLPKHLLWILINKGFEDFEMVLFSSNYESPELWWNNNMLEYLQGTMDRLVQDYRTDLIKYASQRSVHSSEDMPKFKTTMGHFEYPHLKDELICGPFHLRVWVYASQKRYKIDPKIVPQFMINLYALLNSFLETDFEEKTPKDLSDLLIILRAHAKAIKSFNITNYSAFPEIIQVLEHFTQAHLDKFRDPANVNVVAGCSSFIYYSAKIIFRAIRVPNSQNLSTFVSNNGISVIIKSLDAVFQKVILETRSNEELKSRYDLSPTVEDVKALNLFIRSLAVLGAERSGDLKNLDDETKLHLFMSIQRIAKIPLTLCDNLKAQFYEGITRKEEEDRADEAQIQRKLSSVATKHIFVLLTHPSLDSAERLVYQRRIFKFYKNIIEFFRAMSCNAHLTALLIQAGAPWRCLEFVSHYENFSDSVDKMNDLNLKLINENAEPASYAVRNVLIWANEAYLYSARSTQQNGDEHNSPQQVSKFREELESLDERDLEILVRFREASMKLIGSTLTELLLEDATEPNVNATDKDKAAAVRFLEKFSSPIYEPLIIWNEETRNELKYFLKQQLHSISNNRGEKDFDDKLENHSYSTHASELIIDGIFVRMFNQSPDWKVPNPDDFTNKLMEEIRVRVTELQDKKPTFPWTVSQDRKDISSDLAYKISSLTESIKGILNISNKQHYNPAVFAKENLTCIAHLLNTATFSPVNDPSITNLKIQALNALIYESGREGGPVKCIENVTIIRNIILCLRYNNKETPLLCEKIIRLIENIASNEHMIIHLVNYGVLIILLESLLKTELLPRSYRMEALKFVSRIARSLDYSHPLNKIILSLLPKTLHYILYTDLPPLDAVNILDNGIDGPKIVWTPLMRQEVLMLTSEECQSLQESWCQVDRDYMNVAQKKTIWTPTIAKLPIYPEYNDLIQIEGVFIKNFNINSLAVININMAIFLEEVSVKAEDAFQRFMKLMNEYENAPRNNFTEGQLKELDRLSCEVVTLMTTLMFSIEQFLYNKRHSMSTHYVFDDSHPETVGETKVNNIELFSEGALTSITKWTSCLGYKKVNPHIKCTILQLIYLVADFERGLARLKAHDIVSILAHMLKTVNEGETNLTSIEEKVTFHIILRLVLKDPQLVPEVVSECLEVFRAYLLKGKSYARDIIENIMGVVVNDLDSGRNALLALNKDDNLVKVSTLAYADPKTFANNKFWRRLDDKEKIDLQQTNLLNTLYKGGVDQSIKFPVVSDYALKPLPHPSEENLKVIEEVEEFTRNMVQESLKTDYIDSPQRSKRSLHQSNSKAFSEDSFSQSNIQDSI